MKISLIACIFRSLQYLAYYSLLANVFVYLKWNRSIWSATSTVNGTQSVTIENKRMERRLCEQFNSSQSGLLCSLPSVFIWLNSKLVKVSNGTRFPNLKYSWQALGFCCRIAESFFKISAWQKDFNWRTKEKDSLTTQLLQRAEDKEVERKKREWSEDDD